MTPRLLLLSQTRPPQYSLLLEVLEPLDGPTSAYEYERSAVALLVRINPSETH